MRARDLVVSRGRDRDRDRNTPSSVQFRLVSSAATQEKRREKEQEGRGQGQEQAREPERRTVRGLILSCFLGMGPERKTGEDGAGTRRGRGHLSGLIPSHFLGRMSPGRKRGRGSTQLPQPPPGPAQTAQPTQPTQPNTTTNPQYQTTCFLIRHLAKLEETHQSRVLVMTARTNENLNHKAIKELCRHQL